MVTDRYSRQIIFPKIGLEGQQKLNRSFAVVVGCGGLGGVIAMALVRAGVGKIRLLDRDLVEYHNLHRQVLFDEDDAKKSVPKAVAAERYLKKVNSAVTIEGIVTDVNYANIEKLVSGADLILDGLDNLETRFLINDVSLKMKIPWIYGGAVAASGMTMTFVPGETACFRCAFPGIPPPGIVHSCDTAGVIGPAPFIVGALQAAEAIKFLVGAKEINRDIIVMDIWQGNFRRFHVNPRPDCPACQGKYEFLQGQLGLRTTILCSQNSVQVSDPGIGAVSLGELASRLKPFGKIKQDEMTLQFNVDNQELVIFPDGRAILRNSFDEDLARALYTKYVKAE